MGCKERGDPSVPSAMGIPRPGLGAPRAAVQTVGGPPADGHGALGFVSPEDGGPDS